MKILVIISFIVFGYGLAFAQFDPDCYYPKIGEEIDTIYGSMNNQQLGRGFDTVPRYPSDVHARIGTYGLPGHLKEFTTFKTGPGFDINNLQGLETSGGLDPMNYVDRNVRYGHFRSPKYLDMIVSNWNGYFPDTIYWADDSGRYNRERYTSFVSPFPTDSAHSWDFTVVRPSYVTYMTSDTVEDIVMGGGLNQIDSSPKYYLLLYKGGYSLYEQGKQALPDSILELGNLNGTQLTNGIEAGDFRGTGRKDAIIYRRNKQQFNDIFYYKNDPPFSLSKFYNSMCYDTLMTAWENKVFREYNPGIAGCPIMSAYRRDPSDPTKDFLLMAETADDRHLSLWLFKGGSDFGSKRLYLDSPSYFFWHPSHYDGGTFISAMSFFDASTDMGDMTGTGNPVLCARGILPVGGQTCLWGFYVLGDAMDDKIDMFFTTQKVGWPKAITADNDNMTDAVLGMPFICSEKDKSKGWDRVGSMGLLRGSKKIPVKKNAADYKATLQTGTLSMYPNPANNATILSFTWDKNEVALLSLWDILGNKVFEQEVSLSEGVQSRECQLNLPSGTYLVKLTGASQSVFSQLLIVR